MRLSRGYAAAAALLAAATAGLLGACTTTGAGPTPTAGGSASGSSQSSGSTPSSAVPTTSPSNSAALPYPTDVPAEARANTEAGAIAFARHFFAQLNKAYTTPRAGLIAPLSTSTCKSCAAYEEHASTYITQHAHYNMDALQVKSASVSSDTDPAATLVLDVAIRQLPARLINAQGATVEEYDDQQATLVLYVVRSGDKWLANSVKVRQ